MKTLVLGGVRSGKSRYAESLAHAHDGPVTVIATAVAGGDAELAARIAVHRARRPVAWSLVEEPRALAAAIDRADSAGGLVLVECLTLWLTNLLAGPGAARSAAEIAALERSARSIRADLVLVGNEVGLGVVPLGALSRAFVDLAGSLHQSLGAVCDRVVFTAAGLPWCLKGSLP